MLLMYSAMHVWTALVGVQYTWWDQGKADPVELRWIQTGVTEPKHLIRVEIGDLLSRVTLKFHRWHWKTTGHLFYATLSFV